VTVSELVGAKLSMAEIKIRLPGSTVSVSEDEYPRAGNKVSQEPSPSHGGDGAALDAQVKSSQQDSKRRHKAWLSLRTPLVQKVRDTARHR